MRTCSDRVRTTATFLRWVQKGRGAAGRSAAGAASRSRGVCALLRRGRHPGRPPAELPRARRPRPDQADHRGHDRPGERGRVRRRGRVRGRAAVSELSGELGVELDPAIARTASRRRPGRERPPALLRRQARGPLRGHRILPVLRRPELAADHRAQPLRRVLRPQHQPLARRSRASRRSTAGPSSARPIQAPTWPSPRSRPTPMSWSTPRPTRATRRAIAGCSDSRPPSRPSSISSTAAGQTPFIDFGGTARALGSAIVPTTLTGLTWTQIAADLPASGEHRGSGHPLLGQRADRRALPAHRRPPGRRLLEESKFKIVSSNGPWLRLSRPISPGEQAPPTWLPPAAEAPPRSGRAGGHIGFGAERCGR